MNSEFANFSHSQWPLPSPTHTPNSTGSQVPSHFQTPKPDVEGHFANAWCTPELPGTHTPAGTPITHKFSDTQLARLQVQTPITPPDSSFRPSQLPLSSAPGTADLDATPRATSKHQIRSQALGQISMDPFQIQTPPPTRDTPGQRRSHAAQTMMMQQYTPSHPTSDMLSTPGYVGYNMQHQQLQQTPTALTPQNNFSSYNFSPADFQFAPPGPMSAPPVPNRQFLWDQNSAAPEFMQYPQSAVHQNAFAPSIPVSPTFVGWPSTNQSSLEARSAFQAFNTPGSSQDAAGGADFWMSSNTNSQSHHIQPPHPVMQSQILPSNVPAPSLNPSALQNVPPPATLQHTGVPKTLNLHNVGPNPRAQDYRTPEPKEKVSVKKGRSGSRNLLAQSAPPRPGLQRSATDGASRMLQRSSREMLPVTVQSSDPVPRRSSPLKRASQINLNVIPEASTKKPRVRTRLIIDENGRAATVTVNEDDDDVVIPSKPLMDSWVDGDSSDEDVPIISARNSFIAAPLDSFSAPKKHSRNVSDDMGPSSIKRPLSRQLSTASLASLTQRLQQTPLASKQNRDARRTSRSSFSGVIDSASSSRRVSMDVPADAQAALRRVMDDRKQRQEQSTAPQALLRAHNQRWSQASQDLSKLHQQQAPPSQYHLSTNPADPFSSANHPPSLSPTINTATESEGQTPHTDFSNEDFGIRCVCGTVDNITNDGRALVQCDTCCRYLHTQCVGLDPTRPIANFVCAFCGGQSPMKLAPAYEEQYFASPLGYKDTGFIRR